MAAIRITLLIIIILVITVYAVYNSNGFYNPFRPSLEVPISVARAKRYGVILDARTLQEREVGGFYPNSIPYSVDDWRNRSLAGKDTTILVYCNAGNRAQTVAYQLYDMGYKNVNYITKPFTSLLPGSQ
jgi:rhodanese-related sulfurtransferase